MLWSGRLSLSMLKVLYLCEDSSWKKTWSFLARLGEKAHFLVLPGDHVTFFSQHEWIMLGPGAAQLFMPGYLFSWPLLLFCVPLA